MATKTSSDANTFSYGSGTVDNDTARVVTATDSPEVALFGALTETAPANDTASSGLNGRLQRIAQNITSLIAALAAGIVVRFATRASRGRQVTTITGTSETTIVTAGSSGVFRDLFMLLLSNTSATATNVTIKDATAGTTVMTVAVPAGQTVGYTVPSCDALKQAASANNWTATLSTGVTSLFVTAVYVEN